MNQLRSYFILVFALAFPTLALSDGLPLESGRYVQAKVTVIELTADQREYIECVRKHHTDNTKTPYVFRLTAAQAAKLRKEAGLSPSRFQVYETYRGYNDAGPHWNLALRFTEAQIEIPHDLLVSNQKAAHAEYEVLGWRPNPSIHRSCAKSRAAR